MTNNTDLKNTHIPNTVNSLPIRKIICVGRNYADHAKELGNDVPEQPLLFLKPSSALTSIHEPISLPNPSVSTSFSGEVHFETELCVQIGTDLVNATLDDAKKSVSGVTLGLDLTLRDLQNELKTKGHPWERAKAFAGSCVLADWLDPAAFGDFSQVQYQFYLNDELRQQGNTELMLFSVYDLIVEISCAFGLQAGDVIMTGTPKGVGKLASGDKLKMVLGDAEWLGKVAI